MGKLIAVAALAAVTSASAIGVGISAHYNFGIPLGEFADDYKFSVMGFNADVEIDPGVGPLFVYYAIGYQVFKPQVGTNNLTLISNLIGVERPFGFPPVIIYVNAGYTFNMFKTTPLNWNDHGVWFGADIYYFVNPKLGIGANFAYHVVFTTGNMGYKTHWIHPSFGIKYWF